MNEKYVRAVVNAAVLGAFSISSVYAQGPVIGTMTTPAPHTTGNVTRATNVAPAAASIGSLLNSSAARPTHAGHITHTQFLQSTPVVAPVMGSSSNANFSKRFIYPTRAAYLEPMGMGAVPRELIMRPVISAPAGQMPAPTPHPTPTLRPSN